MKKSGLQNFFKSEYEKQEEANNDGLKPLLTDSDKLKNFMKRESVDEQSEYSYTFVIVSAILIAVGFIPFIGLLACAIALFTLDITKSIKDSKIADYIGIVLFSTSVITSISSTVYYVFFNWIWSLSI
jgi:hypothetical protein